MTPLREAYISEAEREGTIAGWMILWLKGDKNTRQVAGNTDDPKLAEEMLRKYVEESSAGKVYLNEKYQVQVRDHGAITHISIRTLDRSAEHDWRDYQEIKNQVLGEECEAVELYPAESRLVDNANQYHLWGFRDPSYRVPIGWQHRMVSDSDHAFMKAQQRPLRKKEGQDG
jgi:hypothetical protein